MQMLKNKKQIAQLLFWVGLSIELFLMVTNHSALEIPYVGRITHVAFLFFACKILLTKYSKKEWMVIAIMGIVGTISYFSMGDEWAIRVMVMVIASKEIPFRQITKYTFFVTLAATVCIIVLSLPGILGQAVDIRDYGRGSVEARWCLGFNHANNVHGTIWYLVSLGLFIYYGKTKLWHYIVLTIANVGLYLLTVSRTGFLLVQLVIIAFLLVRYVKKIKECKWIYLLGLLTIMGLSLFSAVAAKYGPVEGFLGSMDHLLSGRVTFAARWAHIDTWTLFSSPREWLSVDMGIVTLFYIYGYVIGFLYLFVNALLIWKYYLESKMAELILLVTCMLYTFMESSYTINVYLLCNIFFILLFGIWKQKEEGKVVEPL